MDYQAFRESLEMTQQECADACGVTRARWSQYEAGEARPRPETAWAIIELAEENGKRLRLEDIFPRNGDD